MKRFLLLIAVTFVIGGLSLYAGDKNSSGSNSGGDQLQRQGHLTEATQFSIGADDSGFPLPFNETGAQSTPTNAAISTGYYWIDSEETNLNPSLFPNYRPISKKVSLNFEPELWRKISPGPQMLPKQYWLDNYKTQGYPFFRNPADLNFWTAPTDSTDDAIAGPIPLGIKGGFYFNGIRYDSFYVTTNGLVALSNRRYFYDQDGNRVIPAGSKNCYDPMSADWFAGGVRAHDTLFQVDAQGNEIVDPNTLKRIPVYDGGGNLMYKDGLHDAVADNFGYQFMALGMDPKSVTSYNPFDYQGGIRQRGGAINSLNPNCKAAIITPFWGDLMLSQYNPTLKQREEFGTCWYKYSYTADSLVIYFENIQPKGNLAHPFGSYNAPADERPSDQSYVTADAQIVLSRIDSSITIHYNRLSNAIKNSYREARAADVFRYNTTCGIRGFARHVNYGKGGVSDGGPWAGEYVQYSLYYDRYQVLLTQAYPVSLSAVKFKQWKNILRVADIQYLVRSIKPDAVNPLAFVDPVPSSKVADYELLAGHERLGAIQPVALIQNLTNEIQGPSGVNFVKQDLEFRARFRIINQITGRIIYNRIVPIDALCMSLPDTNTVQCNGDPTVKVRLCSLVTKSGKDYKPEPYTDFTKTGFNGVPPYYFVQVYFPAFEPNEFIPNHIGRHKAYIIADPTDPRTGDKLGDQWPFDDTMSVRLFVMKRFSDEDPDPNFQSFEDDGTFFHVDQETGISIPSAWKWVNLNAEMVSGDIVSAHALPPRGTYTANNVPTRTITSPVIKMNRTQPGGIEPPQELADKRSPARNGDELRSFPIDLRGKYNATLSLALQRGSFNPDWKRGFDDQLLVGPEPRVCYTLEPNQPGFPFFNFNVTNAASAVPDEFCVEFAKPSDDGIAEITNVPLANWTVHPQGRGHSGGNVTDVPALTVYGGGGYMIGFLETDKDSSLTQPDAGGRKFNALRADQYDDGLDLEYRKFFVPVPDTFINWKKEGAKNFRFRLKVFATNDQKCADCISDDDDDFFVDNVKLAFPAEVTDIEILSVRTVWPYSMVPASQATSIPVRVKVSNNTSLDAPTFIVKVKIFRTDANGNLSDNDPIYCRTQSIGNLTSGKALDVEMPSWNARASQLDTLGYYRMFAYVVMPEPDLVPKNDSTYFDTKLLFGRNYAYDPAEAKPTNNVNEFVNSNGGKGLNMWGSSFAGSNSQLYDPIYDATGTVGGLGSGAFAMRFEVRNTDTLKGFSAFWGGLNKSSDQVTFRLYEGLEAIPSNTMLLAYTATRGGKGTNLYDRYVDYTLAQPYVLPSGYYWLSVSQDGETGFELGASSSRSGMKVTHYYVDQAGVWGAGGITVYADKNFREVKSGNLVNINLFAYQNNAVEGPWVQMAPSKGNPGYGHLNARGDVNDGTQPGRPTWTVTRGTWIPMIRPYFGLKTYGEDADKFQWCPDDIPVELAGFDGKVRGGGIDLFWETASENNNYGFQVERRVFNDENSEWKQIGFVNGHGTANVTNDYNFTDKDVKIKTTYQYRLRQIDKDGSEYCNTTKVVTLTYDKLGNIEVSQQPNPFVNQTTFTFTLNRTENVRIEVLDMFGNVVKVVQDGELGASMHAVPFDGTDAEGNQIANGTYIYRLTAGDQIVTGKMSLMR